MRIVKLKRIVEAVFTLVNLKTNFIFFLDFAPLYFLSFILICNFIVINLFIFIIIEQYEAFTKDDNLETFKENLNEFRKSWCFFSNQYGGRGNRINQKHLIDFFFYIDSKMYKIG